MRTRDPLAFLPGVGERLGYYFYALRDPRDGAISTLVRVRATACWHARHAQQGRPVGPKRS
jgi:hypothetical protein